MKLGAKNVEWVLIIGLIVTALTQFLLISVGMENATMQALTNNLLLLIFSGQMLLAILLLRIYDKLR